MRLSLAALSAAAALLTCSAAHADAQRAAVVNQLYRDFPADSHNQVISDAPNSVLNRYFSPKLAALLHRDDQCRERSKGVCALEFDPLYDSQDPEARGLRVVDGAEVTVSFKRSNGGREETVTIRCRMVRTKAGWRIDDLIYPKGPSLSAILSRN